VRILQISSEAYPWAKTGGLADVVGALSTHLAERGHEVTVVLPLYREIREAGFAAGPPVLRLGPRRLGVRARATVRRLEVDSPVQVLVVDAPALYDREGLYGTGVTDHPDNLLRFSAFVRAALCAAGESPPEVLHAHDWQAALAPVLLRAGAPPAGVLAAAGVASVLTLHNLAYQGRFPAESWPDTGLPAGWLRPDRLELFGGINLLKGGILAADRVTTVSPRYAREITTPEFGFGLEGLIAGLASPVEGILNGIDVSAWDPRHDPHLPAPFGPDDLSGKAEAKAAVQSEMGLPGRPDVPLFGFVSRLIEQKGLGLVDALRDRFAGWPAQFALVGAGEPRYERLLRELAAGCPNVGARVVFSERLAHLVEAGSDFFLMPSAFEPCGLNQMISQRYGTVPVVHRVGGLADSVTDATPETLAAGTATGVVFDHFDPHALAWAIETAIELHGRPASLRALREAGMRADFSWAASGRRYEELYERLLAGDAAGGG
jgi:starch synthase